MVTLYQRRIRELVDAYRGYLLSKVSKVRIFGEVDERELKDVFVELSIVDQRAPQQQAEFLGMMDSAMRRRFNPFQSQTLDGSPDLSGGQAAERRVKPDKLLRLGTKAIVTGTPGCGKTTLLRYLALQAQQKESRLVVWLELKAINKTLFGQAEKAAAQGGVLILQELWLKHLKTQLSLSAAEIKLWREHWQEQFKANNITVLLDGFDELQDEAIERSLNKCVSEFVSAAHYNTLLISTRPYAQHRLGSEGLEELEIEALTERQIEAFLDCYYPNDAATKSLLTVMRERLSLRDLLRVPLLLGVILRLHRENRFTDERLKLYETIITDLIHELDRSKSVSRQFKINDERLRLDFLKFLAFERLLRDPLDDEEQEANRIVFSYDLLKEKARTFLARERSSHNARELADDALATPLLREVAADTFAFTHLTLQEYLGARAFAAFYKSDEIEGLRIFCRAYYNPTIVELELLPMTLGAGTSADKLYAEVERWSDSLTYANLRLRARGLQYSAKIKQDRLSKLIDRLVEFISRKNIDETPYRGIVINSFEGVSRQTIRLIETKSISLFETDTPDFLDPVTFPSALGALRNIGSNKAVDALVSALNSTDRRVRWNAVNYLGGVDSDKAVDALISSLNDEDYGVREIATRALGRNSTDKALDTLISALNHQDKNVRTNAALTLGSIDSPKAVAGLVSALKDEVSFVRGRAAEALGRIGTDRAIDVLLPLLTDEDSTVRLRTVQALGRLGTDKAVTGLRSALNDNEGRVRLEAAEVLRQLGNSDAVNVAFAALTDEDWYVRSGAAEALGNVCSDKSVAALTAALHDEDIYVRSDAAKALGKIGSDAVIGALLSILNDEDSEVRASVAEALGNIGSQTAADILITMLTDKDGYVRGCAAEGLGRIASDKVTEALIAALSDDEDHFVRWLAAEALGNHCPDKAVDVLISALNDEDPHVRSAAAESLARVKVESLVSELARTVRSHSTFARKKAVAVIGYYSNSEQTLDQLKQLAETDEDRDVRAVATGAAERFARKLGFLDHLTTGPAQPMSDNESRELFLVGEAFKVAAAAGHIFRPTPNSDWGIDGEIEFKNADGEASGQRAYLQLKSGDSYLRQRKRDGKEIFTIKPRHAEYWLSHAYPVLLVIRDSSGRIRWMNVTEYLKSHPPGIKQIEFQGQPFTADSVKQMRARFAR